MMKLFFCRCVFQSSSYPGGNFGGNQLLNSSIGLSPLCPHETNDLHVSIATSLHQSFLWLRPLQARFTVFRVLTAVLKLDSFTPPVTQKLIQIGRRCRQASLAPRAFPPFTFISRRFFYFSALSYRRHSHARQTPWSVFQDGSIRPLLCQCILSTQLILAPQESSATTV